MALFLAVLKHLFGAEPLARRRSPRAAGVREVRSRFALLHFAVCVLAFASSPAAFGHSTSQLPAGTVTVTGTVCDGAGVPLPGAMIAIEDMARKWSAKTLSAKDGTFEFAHLLAGRYRLNATKQGFQERSTELDMLSGGASRSVTLTLSPAGNSAPQGPGQQSSSAGTMEFDDRPNFTVAGVTDWSNSGGHGSDASQRAGEALARDTAALKSAGRGPSGTPGTEPVSAIRQEEELLREALVKDPGDFQANHALGEFYLDQRKFTEAIPLLHAAYQLRPSDAQNAIGLVLALKEAGEIAKARALLDVLLRSEDRAAYHRLLGDISEGENDPLTAVREYERAASLDPDERNYFSWGSELLVHRAVQPAIEVFRKGIGQYPSSFRLLSGLGAALYAAGEFDAAALQVCKASDLAPRERAPYLFLGRMEKAAPSPLGCALPRLERFARQNSKDAEANYLYAVALLKRGKIGDSHQDDAEIESLLRDSISADPKFADAFLQLGILYAGQGKDEEALKACLKAAELEPDSSEVHFHLAALYKHLGQIQNAQRELDRYKATKEAASVADERQRRELRQFLVITKPRGPAGNQP